MNIARYLILWISFIILFSVAVVGLELLEGHKIMTTEYFGLRNTGFIFIVMIFLIVLIYSLLGGKGGILIFPKIYNDRFVQEYHLNISSSILIFGVVGFIYALMDNYLDRRKYYTYYGRAVVDYFEKP